MPTNEIRLDRYCAQAEGVRGRLVLGTWNSYGIEQLQLVLGDGWEGRTVTAVFHGPKTSAGTTVLAGSDGLVDVPQEATAAAGCGTITIVGVDADSQRISVDIPYVVMSHAPVTGQAPDPTPDIWQQFVAQVEADADRAEQAAGDAAKSAEAAAESAKQAEQAGADIGAAKDAALEAIQQAQDTGVKAVEGATTTGVQAAIGQVQQAGQAQLDKINAANALVPTPTQEDAGKAIIVKPDGSGYELGELKTDAYTKAESDARYAPITAAIRPTVGGNPATLEHSVAWAMQGLSLYGKSTQDGTPSPDNPVPIVSAGDAGSIVLTVSDGAAQSQQLVISTPNGLPGIPIDSGGNFTDADGQQWICDEVDFQKGTINKSTVLLHVKNFTFRLSSSSETPFFSSVESYPNGIRIKNNLYQSCSHFVCENPFVSKNDNIFFASPTQLYIRMLKCSTAEEFNEWVQKNDPILLAQMETPIETPLSEEELAEYAALSTYDGTTIVSTEAPVAGLSARYVVDGAAYIESKIQAAVTQAVAAAESLTGGAK